MIIHNDIEAFVAVKPASYRFLKAIGFVRTISIEGCTGYNIEITLSKIADGKIQDMKVQCVNAVDIKVGNIESMHGMQLEIEDVAKNQLEGISYLISEQENSTFSFSCSEFYIDLLDYGD
jgi:hypothetical protein